MSDLNQTHYLLMFVLIDNEAKKYFDPQFDEKKILFKNNLFDGVE